MTLLSERLSCKQYTFTCDQCGVVERTTRHRNEPHEAQEFGTVEDHPTGTTYEWRSWMPPKHWSVFTFVPVWTCTQECAIKLAKAQIEEIYA